MLYAIMQCILVNTIMIIIIKGCGLISVKHAAGIGSDSLSCSSFYDFF